MKTPIQLEMDSVLEKHILYLTVSLDGLFRFLSHAYFFPLNDAIPITREHSFSYPGHILLTSVQTFIHSMEDQEYQDDLVLAELEIDLSTFPTDCVTHVENVWYISYNIPTRLIRKLLVATEETKRLLLLPLSNLVIDENLIFVSPITSTGMYVKNPNLLLPRQSKILPLMQKIVAAFYAFFEFYSEVTHQEKKFYSDYHILVLRSIFHDTIEYEHISLSSYEPVLDDAIQYLMGNGSMEDLHNRLVNKIEKQGLIFDILSFLCICKYLIHDFNFDIDARMTLDGEVLIRSLITRISQDPTIAEMYRMYFGDVSTTRLEDILVNYAFNDQLLIRKHIIDHWSRSVFLSLFPILCKSITARDLSELFMLTKNYGLHPIYLAILLSIKVLFDGFGIIPGQNKATYYLYEYLERLPLQMYRSDENQPIQRIEDPKACIKFTKNNFPLRTIMITKLNILKAYLEQKYARDKKGLMRILQKTVNEYYTSEAIALLSSASIFKNNMTETDLKRCIVIKYLSNKNFDAFYQSIIHANETTYRNNPKLFDAILKGISNEA